MKLKSQMERSYIVLSGTWHEDEHAWSDGDSGLACTVFVGPRCCISECMVVKLRESHA